MLKHKPSENHPLHLKLQLNGSWGNATTIKILKASLRQSTHCKYNNYIKHWLDSSKTIRKIEVTHVLDFLSAMFEKGHAYSTINSAKCARATIYIYHLMSP